MEISYVNVGDLKTKFGFLLSYLYHSVHISVENISDVLVSSPLLDMLEDNKLDEFMAMTNYEILMILFPNAKEIENESNNDIGKLYWSGIQYINIFLNYRIPLRQILLTLPLSEMVKKYDVYHEMNEIELCKDYMKAEYQFDSILKYFRNQKKLSIRQLSLLTSISESALKYLESNNNYIFNISSKNMIALSNVLNMDLVFYKKKSDFIPITFSLLQNKLYVTNLSIAIGKYLNKPFPNLNIRFFKEKESNSGEVYLYINEFPYIEIDGKEKYIDGIILRKLLSIGLDEYLSEYLKSNLVF